MTPASRRVSDALRATYEACGGGNLSTAGAAVMLLELGRYPERDVLRSLTRCLRECKGRLALADVVERIDDGRPSPDEAWALVGTTDEGRTLVAPAEAMEALGMVRELLRHDHVAARMAFKDRYKALVSQARSQGWPARWIVSLGHDQACRAAVLKEAVALGRLDQGQADRMLGQGDAPIVPAVARLLDGLAQGKTLEAEAAAQDERTADDFLAELKKITEGKKWTQPPTRSSASPTAGKAPR